VVPMTRLVEQRRRGDEPGPAEPTRIELLVEI
jgi:large conductance mechanosensitive channel